MVRGNIGTAPFEFINKLKKDDYVVLELSSFQLEDLHKSPHIAVLTNFSPEHLAPADPNNPNYHKNLKSYWLAKSQIFAQQKKNDYFIVNERLNSPLERGGAERRGVMGNAQVVKFIKSELESNLPGEHNKENIAAAVEVAKLLKINDKIIAKAVKIFKGLEHRIEKVIEKNGITYYDDSFATIPDSAVIALKSFNQPIVLLAGGADKGANFKNFAKEIKKRVKFLILFKGIGSERIITELEKINYSKKNYKIVDNMKKAMELANKRVRSGDIVLLSPGCASFGVFKNYKERGNLFKEAI